MARPFPGAVRNKGLTVPAPMLATARPKPPRGDDWTFEVKLDGLRTLASVEGQEVTLTSRNGVDVTDLFPEVRDGLRRLELTGLVLDGEIVVAGSDGAPSFERAMERFQAQRPDIGALSRSLPAEYVVFDLLASGGWDLLGCRADDRRRLLDRSLPRGPHVRTVDSFSGDGDDVLRRSLELGFEGIVAKRTSGTYRPGKRSADWLKVKRVQTEDFVIAGWTDGAGARSTTFGSLVLAQTEDGRLVHAGNVGTGFDFKTARDVLGRIAADERETSPLHGSGPTDRVHWVEPVHWVEVKFMKKTAGNKLRMPSFVRMRPDKDKTHASPVTSRNRAVDEVFEALRSGDENVEVDAPGGELRLTNLDKVLWPAHGGRAELTKRDLILYYATVAPALLPHLADRPLTLIRMPDGLSGERILQKHVPYKMPAFVQTVDVWSESRHSSGSYVLCNDLWTLIWLGQMGTVEIHPWFSRTTADDGADRRPTTFAQSEAALDASALNYPDVIVFDLDPYVYSGKEAPGEEPEPSPEAFQATVRVARQLKRLTDRLGLDVFLKTSGKTGLHAFLPIVRDVPFEECRELAAMIGRELVAADPGRVTVEWAVKKRPGKVFFDYNMNARGKTLASVYSPRALPGAPVSCPVEWSRLGRTGPETFDIRTVMKRVATRGDAWSGLFAARQDLREVLSEVLRSGKGRE
ncbi:MAG: non-homologous end-joining DNA ligase [Armatimonadetes bacterium]|nr:non-homologous end-joining DNA ligase [Armatimonadota bacterium]